jgi:hypothetical protein
MTKFWWKDEPLIVGSLRWRVIDNDLKNNIRECFEQFKATTTIEEVVQISHNKGLTIRFELVERKDVPH